MAYEITRAEVWSGSLENQPGALAERLEAVMRAGANLDFVIVRPDDSRIGDGVLYIAPLHGQEQHDAADAVGLSVAQSIHALRIIGPDQPGLAAGVARTLADAGLNISGLSAAAVNDQCILYIRFASDEDVVKATQTLSPKLV